MNTRIAAITILVRVELPDAVGDQAGVTEMVDKAIKDGFAVQKVAVFGAAQVVDFSIADGA